MIPEPQRENLVVGEAGVRRIHRRKTLQEAGETLEDAFLRLERGERDA